MSYQSLLSQTRALDVEGLSGTSLILALTNILGGALVELRELEADAHGHARELADLRTSLANAMDTVNKLQQEADALARDRDGLLSFKASVDEACNRGDGSYRP